MIEIIAVIIFFTIYQISLFLMLQNNVKLLNYKLNFFHDELDYINQRLEEHIDKKYHYFTRSKVQKIYI